MGLKRTAIIGIIAAMACCFMVLDTVAEADTYPITITFHYDLDGGTGEHPTTDPVTQPYGTTINMELYGGEIPTKEHALFQYWEDQEDTFFRYYEGMKPLINFYTDGDKTYKAIWIGHWEANVIMDPNGGTLDFDGIISQSTTTAAESFDINIPVNKPTREGYSFQYWALNEDGTDKVINNRVTVPVDGTKTIYAIWAKTYTVQFDAEEGYGNIEKQIVLEGEKIRLPSSQIYDNKIVSGWYEGSNFVGKSGGIYTVTKDVTLTAAYSQTCTVTYDGDPYVGKKIETTYIGASYYVGYNAKINHYILEGWTKNDTLIPLYSYIEITGDTYLKASWKPLMRTVTFNSNGGSAVEPITIQDGEIMSPPKNPTMKGFAFKGWYINGEEWHFSVPVTKDMTLVAEYEPKEELDLDVGLILGGIALIVVSLLVIMILIRKH